MEISKIKLLGDQFLPLCTMLYETSPLSLLFKQDGVLPAIIMDNCKENFTSDFRKKLGEANYYQKMIKTHSPWSRVTDMNIHELECVRSHKMIKTQSLNQF